MKDRHNQSFDWSVTGLDVLGVTTFAGITDKPDSVDEDVIHTGDEMVTAMLNPGR